jgi:hypothetical protein
VVRVYVVDDNVHKEFRTSFIQDTQWWSSFLWPKRSRGWRGRGLGLAGFWATSALQGWHFVS